MIWDAVEGCEHVWGDECSRPRGGNPNQGLAFTGTGAPETRTRGLEDRIIKDGASSQGQFCQICGAWRGCLGLEPTPDCGRPFMELRDDLTDKEREYVMSELKKAGLI